MSSTQTYLEQDLVNIIASMTLQLPQYPRNFFEAGYRVEFIERDFEVRQDGEYKEVKFDIILNNIDKNHSINFECKSGRVEYNQLIKYSKLSSEELVKVGGISSNSPTMHSHDVTIVFNDENYESVIKETVNLSVSINPTKLTLNGRTFQDDDLNMIFDKMIEYPGIVYEVFRVNEQTSLHKYVKLIADEMISKSVKGENEFKPSEIIPEIASSIPGFYPSRIGKNMRSNIEQKTLKVIDQGSKYELRDFFEWNKDTDLIKLTKIKSGCKGTTLVSFKQKVKEMSERIRKGEPVPKKYLKKDKTDENQLTFNL